MIENLRHHINHFLTTHNQRISVFERNYQFKPHSVRNIMTGKSKNPNLDLIHRLSCVLGIPIDYMLKTTPENQHTKPRLWYEIFLNVLPLVAQAQTVPEDFDIFEGCTQIYRYCLKANNGRYDATYARWWVTETLQGRKPEPTHFPDPPSHHANTRGDA